MIQMTLTYGSTTIDLQASGRVVLDGYYPEVSSDGSKVTDRVDVWVTGTTAEIQASIQAINQAFQYAKDHPNGSEGCWLNYAVNTTESTWRSRVTNGAVMHDAKLDARWRQGRALLALAIERLPFWEGAETDVPLSNPNGTNLTTGINVYNCNDGAGATPNKRNNYVEIAAADVEGDLPAPMKLMVTNTYATNRLMNLWIGHNYTDPANSIWNLEAEAADGVTAIAKSDCSGGYEVSKTVNIDIPLALFIWTLTSAQISAAKGQWVHAIPRFSNADSLANIRFSFAIRWSPVRLIIWESDPFLPVSLKKLAIMDMASFRLPPWLQASGDLSELQLAMYGQRTVSSDQPLSLDFLQLIPADGFRYLVNPMYGVPSTYRIVDDGISGELFQDDGADLNRAGVVSGYGDPILLQPNKLQRLYFLMHSSLAYTAEIDRSISVKATYRPRRTSV